ncbi:hypothetical protein O181_033600 [Austropuccinia psidii MF-1]|uniref:Uncharacterized protein n=1 Tax=Austropuccinia psidii MF-1 TaxID=1389203 RepID=A0A9Q3H9D9_9BASI|nr:hypothetical protein [Austropuccinia psidii MF-1]
MNDPPFISIPGALAFLIYVYSFNAPGKSSRLASIGPIMLIFLNISPSEGLKLENVYVARLIPGQKEPTSLQLNYLLTPLINVLKGLYQGYHFSPTSTGPSGSFIPVSILTVIADVVAICKLTGFISHSGNHFCTFCCIHKAQMAEIGPQFHYRHTYPNYKSTILKWLWATPKQTQAILSKYGDHAAFKLCIPEAQSKIYFRSRRKSNDTRSSDSDSLTSNSSLDQITSREALSLRRDTTKIMIESIPTTSTQQKDFTMPTPNMQHPSSGSMEIPSFDVNYIPTSEFPSELDISALSDHKIKVKALDHLQ